MSSDQGYSWSDDTLQAIKRELTSGAKEFDGAAGQAPPAVDAGASSDRVASVLSRLLKLGAATAQSLDRTSGKVDTAHGAYDDLENDNKGRMKYVEKGLPTDGPYEQYFPGSDSGSKLSEEGKDKQKQERRSAGL